MFEGITVPMVTPMQPDGSLDQEAASRLVARFAQAGVHAVMLAGTSGEGHALGTHELRLLAKIVGDRWRADVGVHRHLLVTVSAPSTRAALERARAVADLRPDAIVVGAPYFFRYTEAELLAHVSAFEAVGLPIVVYDTPRYSGNPFGIALRARLASLPYVVGIKDSAADRDLLGETLHLSRTVGAGFEVLQGDESGIVAALRMGATGAVPGPANLAPRTCVELYRAATNEDWVRADRLQGELDRLGAIHRVRRGIVATKAALESLGLCDSTASAPFQALDETEHQALVDVLAACQVTLDRERGS